MRPVYAGSPKLGSTSSRGWCTTSQSHIAEMALAGFSDHLEGFGVKTEQVRTVAERYGRNVRNRVVAYVQPVIERWGYDHLPNWS
jgi:hypothetical protein